MVVDIEDVNDVPPRFSRPEWTLDVSESLGPDHVLATLTVIDPDATNDFAFRVTVLPICLGLKSYTYPGLPFSPPSLAPSIIFAITCLLKGYYTPNIYFRRTGRSGVQMVCESCPNESCHGLHWLCSSPEL